MEQKSGASENRTDDQAPGGNQSVSDGLNAPVGFPPGDGDRHSPDVGGATVLDCFCKRAGIACRSNDMPVFKLLLGKKTDEAYELAGRAVIENPACWKMQRALAHCFMQQHRPQFAIPHFCRAIVAFRANGGAPVNFIRMLLTELGRALLQDGQLPQAKDAFERAAVYEPAYLPAKIGIAETIERMTATGARGFNGHKLLDQGQAHERAGRYAEAWDCYARAKQDLQARGFKYDRAPVVARFSAYKAGCTSTLMRRFDSVARETWGEDPRVQPVFVLGYPRSGTTLLEQCLTAAGSIAAGGELPAI